MPGWYKVEGVVLNKVEGVVLSFVFSHFLCQISSRVSVLDNGRRRTSRARGSIFCFSWDVFASLASFLVVAF